MLRRLRFLNLAVLTVLSLSVATAIAADKADTKAAKKAAARAPKKEPTYPPTLNNGQTSATDTSPAFLKKPVVIDENGKPQETIRPEVLVAKTAPTIDFAFVPGQTYPGKPWSAWGESIAANGKYYFS